MESVEKLPKIRAGRRWLPALLAGAVVVSGIGAPTGSRPVAPRQRTVAFTYRAWVRAIPAGAKQVDLWLPVPHDSPFQRITNLTIDAPYSYRIDSAQYGNRVLHLNQTGAKPDSFAVTMRFVALRREHLKPEVQPAFNPTAPAVPDPKADPAMARWRQPDRLVPIDGQIKRWAEDVVSKAGAKTDLQKARAIYNHVMATVKYDKTGTGWGRGDIYYACDVRRGNCTDFHAVFIGYCRAVGIPARFAIGVSLPTDRLAGQVIGYHCWAEFWANGIGWVPVDASEAAKNPAKRNYFFGAHDENRVEFSVGRDLTLHAGQAEPLNYFIYPYAEVDGKPFTTLDKQFEYRNLVGDSEREEKR